MPVHFSLVFNLLLIDWMSSIKSIKQIKAEWKQTGKFLLIYHSMPVSLNQLPESITVWREDWFSKRQIDLIEIPALEWNGKFEWKLGLVVWFVAVSFPLQNEKWNQTNNNNQLSSNYYLIQIVVSINFNTIHTVIISIPQSIKSSLFLIH